jgi:DNA-binding NarL/FixJ family response regulator
MPSLLLDILHHVVELAPDMTIVGQTTDADLASAAKRARADVILVGEDVKQGTHEYAELLRARPALKLLAITDDGKNGTLYEMRPHKIPLGEISAETLRDAIRGRFSMNAEAAAEESGTRGDLPMTHPMNER